MVIYGVDFTSAPKQQKPITCAQGVLGRGFLQIKKLNHYHSFDGFEDLLKSQPPFLAAIDFPFGQARQFIENMDWPTTWEMYVELLCPLGKVEFKKLMKGYPHGEHKRQTDKLAKSVSPQHVDYPPVGLMFLKGAPRLLRSPANIKPVRPNRSKRIVVESYPKLVVKAAIGEKKYKDGNREQSGELQKAREDILDWITGTEIRKHYGFRVKIDDPLREQVLRDKAGDDIDAVLAAIQAAWAYTQGSPRYGIPRNADPVEGWIVDPDQL